MFILTVHWDFRLLWAVLTITAKLYVLCLLTSASAGYSTFSLARIPSNLRQILKRASLTDKDELKFRLSRLTLKIQTLRQFHALLFFLFGICCANEVFATLRSIQYSSMSLSAARIDVFEPVVAFGFFVFVVLLFLHAFQWAVADRVQRALAKL